MLAFGGEGGGRWEGDVYGVSGRVVRDGSQGTVVPPGSVDGVSIRHADPADLDKSSVANRETIEALHAWWERWESLPAIERDRPVADVLTEERNRD
jgi:hypothetical protein